jgi:hypothetical protein
MHTINKAAHDTLMLNCPMAYDLIQLTIIKCISGIGLITVVIYGTNEWTRWDVGSPMHIK